MKKAIMIISLVLALACNDNSSSPSENQVYVYSSYIDEYEVVYSEGGSEVPKAEWSEEITYYHSEFLSKFELLKTIEHDINWKENVFNAKSGNEAESIPFTISEDTLKLISTIFGEVVEIPFLLIIDNNTMELRQIYSFTQTKYGPSENFGLSIDYYQQVIDEVIESKNDLKSGEHIALFARRIIFKRR